MGETNRICIGLMKTMEHTRRVKIAEFGVVMAFAFSVLQHFLDHVSFINDYFHFIAIFFLIFSATFPIILDPLEKGWMKFAHALGWVMNRVLLTIVFYLILTPLAVSRRLLRKKKETGSTYWLEKPKSFSKEDLEKPW